MSKEHLDEFWLNPRLEAGTLKKADTLEALADMMEFDADQKATFLATVERYNGLVAAGEDTDFGKPAYRLSDVETAPFYAARIGGELLVTTHGVITDVNSRPLKNDGTPIEGLYVCGNDQGGFYPHNAATHGHQRWPHGHLRPHRRQARLGRGIGRPLAFPSLPTSLQQAISNSPSGEPVLWNRCSGLCKIGHFS
ncbi:MAG: FAD-binding protein [Adlercreutzia equolifaciens]